jgi:Arc/MetJ-type ribon-helix-helix transcriptional regulator
VDDYIMMYRCDVMVRTQLQLTEEQIRALRLLSMQQNKSMSELVRESVDLLLRKQARSSAVERALGAAGSFRSGKSDISLNHDSYLAEAYAERES